MAKYSDDAKYVSAYNAALKADNQAKLFLQELNKATPGTAKHAELKVKYDKAKATFDAEEAKRVARKKEIDTAASKEKETKTAEKNKASAKADMPQLEYQLQVAKNKGDTDAVKAAEAAIVAAGKVIAGVKTPVQGKETVFQEGGPEDVADNRLKGYSIESSGNVILPNGTRVYFVDTKNADGSTTISQYQSIISARDAFLKNYSAPGQLESLKQELVSRNWITKKQLEQNDWLSGLDNAIAKYTFDAATKIQIEGVKEVPFSSWFNSGKGGAGTGEPASKAGTFKDTDLILTTAGDAYNEINDYMIDAVGRPATQQEKEEYYKDINTREKNSAVETVSTRDATGKITKSTVKGKAFTAQERLNSQNAIVIKALKGTDAGEILASAKGSQVAIQIAALQKAGAEYGQPLTAGEALKYVIAGGTEVDAIAKQTERMRLNALTMYSNLKDHITNGGNVKDIADQYALIKSRKLGIPITDAFNDKDVQMALTRDGGLMSTAEFNRQMQANPLWRQTDEARNTAADFANTILKSFGFMG
jgi:hypothetical protein